MGIYLTSHVATETLAGHGGTCYFVGTMKSNGGIAIVPQPDRVEPRRGSFILGAGCGMRGPLRLSRAIIADGNPDCDPVEPGVPSEGN